MALEAKDFQSQAQWALVAIPAPIYIWALATGQELAGYKLERTKQASARHNQLFTAIMLQAMA